MTIEQAMSKEFRFTMSDRMAKALAVAGIGTQEMADYLGVSRNTVTNYTSGRTEPKKQTVRLWSLRTGTPIEWIETGEWPTDGTDPNKSPSDYKSSSSHPVTPLFTGRSLTGVSQTAA